ncbi:SusC/RagA family TonB-linked outer membrane protein [Chitinophaga sp.]|uniref:SusC/RagA family TonB-linked outer membrane protein n=1 Tax=Chitinophaga sp. TaxID=1869181 RepID=UPI002F954A6D
MRKLSDPSFQRKDTGRFYILTSVIVLFFGLLLASGAIFAQDNDGTEILSRKVSYKAQKYPLSRVLKDLRRQMQVRFTYNDEHVRQQPPITVNMQGVTFEALLNEILKGTDLTYTVTFGGVILGKKEKAVAEVVKPNDMHVVLRGQVISASGVPLAGVSIRALETGVMTVTQPDGNFVLMPRENEQVRFSLLGMKPFMYKAIRTEEQVVRLKMDTIVQAIQEVVVNGYQKIDPRLATGSVTKLTAAQVIEPGAPSIDKMLQGKVPGLMVVNTSGGVNAAPKLRMRGTSTLLGNAAPLWVIDGMIRPDPVDISSALLNNVINNASQSNFELMGNAISGVNPYDIESITFLRDAAATAIYGTRAANGVIVVTTKRGKEGPVQITYNTDLSFQQRPTYQGMNLMNSKERVLLSRQFQEDHVVFNQNGFEESLSYEGLLQRRWAGKLNEEQFKQQVAVLETRNTDWFKELFRNQFSMLHSLSLAGGNEKTTYYASLQYADNKGAAKKDALQKYAANLNLRSKIGKRLTVDLSLNGNFRKSQGYYGINPLSYALQTNRIFSPDDFIPMKNSTTYENEYNLNVNAPPITLNARNEIAHSENTSTVRSVTANLNLDYKLGKGFYFRNSSSFISDASEGMTYGDYYTYSTAIIRGWEQSWTPTAAAVNSATLPVGGMAYMTAYNNTVYSLRNSIDYTTGIFDQRDQINISLGNELNSKTGNTQTHTLPGFFPDRGNIFSPTPRGLQQLASNSLTLAKENAVSLYGTAAYNMKNRYILSATVRADGSNRFGKKANSNFRPNYSISGRWNATMESWFPRGGILSDWQVRASFGTQGNVVAAVGPNLISQYTTAKRDPITQTPYQTIKSMPYPDLRWEKTYQVNLGTNVGFFNDRLTINAEYYEKRTTDVIDQLPIPYEYGMTFMYRNGGKVFNKGLELSAMARLIQRRDASFSLSFSTSRNLNRLANQTSNFGYQSLFTGSGNLPGRAVSGIYSYIFNGLNSQTGIPMFQNVDRPKFTSDPNDLFVYSGQLDPKVTMTLMPTITYKSFSLTSSFYLSLGSVKRLNPIFGNSGGLNGIPAPMANASRDFLNRWRKPGDEMYTNVPVALDITEASQYLYIPYNTGTSSSNGNRSFIQVSPLQAYNQSDLMTVKNDYLRCNALNLRYAVPPARLSGMGMRALSLGFTVSNVFTIANPKLGGQDPEINGVGSSALPMTRQFTGSINASF